ncbi:type VI secretion system Vgr family protein [Cupriavidus sp. UME77]|uniref:type VI secretion system Vgr family protein n=1 Tax=Cupriavidus sp. UME77 TaxID=1862321 RepID=UPI0016015B7F|nr:type VI secretion system Vgr family protein [Cupriavidus sp. UME77]MBB1631589.1 type IV secretion protein Rhs [Cupriavidus sp. UME77]
MGVIDEFEAYGARMPGRQAYHLDVPRAASAAELSVVSFEAVERLGELYTVTIRLTHPLELDRAEYLNRDATFVIDPGDGSEPRRFAGWISAFSRTKRTRDFFAYDIVLRPLAARLELVRTTRIYQNKTAPEIIEAILRRHELRGHQLSLKVRRKYTQHKLRFQYQLSDWEYVQLLMRQEGLYCYFIPGKFGEMIVFGDDIDHYVYQPELRVPYRETAGLEAGIEAVSDIQVHARTVPESVLVADYNPDQAWEPIKGEANVARKDKTTYGQQYIYGTHHLDIAEAKWEAQLRHEALLAGQLVYAGESNVLRLHSGCILRMDEPLAEAPNGQVITEVIHTGGRDAAYRNTYKAIPSDRRFRLPLDEENWPKIQGTLSARITSPGQYKYAYLTNAGHYIVRFDFDFEPWPKGMESAAIPLAKPYAGGLHTGFHFPLIDGTEVAIAFRDGNPNKPYIAHALHNSRQEDLITTRDRWLSRNLIKTQSNNKLRMEDWKGEESIKLSTEYGGKTQLNLGYLVDRTKKKRGEGFELRTDAWGAIRGGKGLFISADGQPKAEGQQLDMQAAVAQLESALQIARALASAATSANAEAADTDSQKQVATALNRLAEPSILASAPASVGIVAGRGAQISARDNVAVVAERNVDISAVKKFTVAAGEVVSMFAQKFGIKLFAGKGKVEIQAQSDAMSLAADKDVTVSSVNGAVRIAAKRELILECGGAFVRLADGNVTIGGPGDLILKVITMQKQGVASLNDAMQPLPKPPGLYDEQFTLRDEHTGEILPHLPYRIETAAGEVIEGVTDAAGRTIRVYADKAQDIKIHKG